MQLNDISSDPHGNLYVSDYKNSCIRIFSSDGESLYSLGCENKLSGPCGVCVAGQYVYVAGWNSHNISVFTTEGAYVTLFGRFKHPLGVCDFFFFFLEHVPFPSFYHYSYPCAPNNHISVKKNVIPYNEKFIHS